MRVRSIGFTLLAAATAPGAAAADLNGFLFEKGRGGVALSYTSEGFDRFWAGNTDVSDPGVGQVDKRTASLWAGIGVTDRLTLTASLPYVDVNTDGAAGFADDGAQDIEVLGQFRVAAFGNTVRSSLVAGAGLRVPVSDYALTSPANIGDGTTDALLRVVYQARWGRFHLSQQVGVDLRGEDARNVIPLYSELGAGWGRVFVSAFYAKQITDGGFELGAPGFTFPGLEDEFDRVGAKVFARVAGRFGVSVAAHTTLSGKNTPDIAGVSAGVYTGF